MRRILTGQIIIIICCIFYMIWWYRCYRPGEAVNRVGGANGILLLSTAAFGIAGAVLSLTGVPLITPPKIKGSVIMAAGIAVICNLNAAGGLSERGFAVMCAVITAAFIVSIILYVAYYRMEEL